MLSLWSQISKRSSNNLIKICSLLTDLVTIGFDQTKRYVKTKARLWKQIMDVKTKFQNSKLLILLQKLLWQCTIFFVLSVCSLIVSEEVILHNCLMGPSCQGCQIISCFLPIITLPEESQACCHFTAEGQILTAVHETLRTNSFHACCQCHSVKSHQKCSNTAFQRLLQRIDQCFWITRKLFKTNWQYKCTLIVSYENNTMKMYHGTIFFKHGTPWYFQEYYGTIMVHVIFLISEV